MLFNIEGANADKMKRSVIWEMMGKEGDDVNKKDQEQLDKFFQHNPVEDSLYLKRYVKDHPDHKMAWYLLGREYAAKGKAAKAAYCFEQSGEIYEAFEKEKMLFEQNVEQTAANGKKTPIKRALHKWTLLVGLLLLASILSTFQIIGDSAKYSLETMNSVIGDYTAGSKQPMVKPIESYIPLEVKEGTQILYTPKHQSHGDWVQALQLMVTPPKEKWKSSVLLGGETSADGKWILWNKQPKALLSMERGSESSNQSQINYYDENLCLCEPGEPTHYMAAINNWLKEKEDIIVLQSAIAAYQKRTGVLPQSTEQLHQPYPNNLLPGVNENMKKLFPSVLLSASSTKPAGTAASETTPNTTPPQPDNQQGNTQALAQAAVEELAEPLQAPLEIIIDKDKHMLYVISGSFVIRSFPVGLGGSKTPEGEFIISEKVRNPNGRSNGEFGSRGMTLSDTLYAIHGTNQPTSIGKDQSLGCVRMLQEDVEELFDMVPHETKVRIGKGMMPEELKLVNPEPSRSFQVPLLTEETNPQKRYKWLN
jgi:lipoprotein-anchoring transpeptidase ErfK/SrfK